MDQKIESMGNFFKLPEEEKKQNGSPNHVPHGAPFL